MSRKKMFLENIFSYGLIGVLDKIIPALFLPVVTRLLPNSSDFGMYNMFTTIVGFATPLAMLGLYDAMFREYFENEDDVYRRKVTVTAQRMIFMSSLIMSSILIIFSSQFSTLFFGNSSHSDIVIFSGISLLFGLNKTPVQGPTRFQNQRNVYAVTGILGSVINYGISIFLIYIGFSYYGLIIGSIVSTSILLIYFGYRNRSFFINASFDFNIAKELLRVGIPLVPTFLIYWIYNSMDRIMITNMLGVNDLGIYSIGAKTAQISQILYTAFAGGFTYFKYKTMKDVDQVRMNSKLFEYAIVFALGAFIVVFPFSEIIFEILYTGDYVTGYEVFPYLFVSPLILMTFQIVASQFIVVKKSYLSTLSLLIGAIINVLLNSIFIHLYGIEGAAVSTMIGYLVSIVSVVWVAKYYNLLIVEKKILLVAIITFIFFVVNRLLINDGVGFLSSTVAIIVILFVYMEEIKSLIFKRG